MRLHALLFLLIGIGEATVPRRMYELSPIPCSSQTGCMEHAHCVAGRCRCQSPYTYYASQCVAGQQSISGPLPDAPSNPMIVPAEVPANSFTQPLQSIYDVPRPPPLSPPLPSYQRERDLSPLLQSTPVVPAPAVPIFTQNEAPPPPPPPAQAPLRVSMGGQTYIMESLVQYPPPALPPPPPALIPLRPAMVPVPPPCIPAPAFPCYYPPPIVLPPATPPTQTTTTRPLRDETITPTEEPTTITTTTTTTTTTTPATTTTEEPTTTTEEPTTTEEMTTTTEEPTTTEEITTLPPITTSVDSILITTTTPPPITTAVLPTVITTTSTTTFRPARDEPIISFPLEPCVIPGTLCVGGSRCVQGMCLCRMNEEVIDGECCAIPQPPPVIPVPPPPTVYQLHPQRCQSQSCCQPGFVFQNQQCNPPPQKIRAINIVVGSQCTNTVQCDRGAYCLSGSCQCANGYHQLHNRCISLRQLL